MNRVAGADWAGTNGLSVIQPSIRPNSERRITSDLISKLDLCGLPDYRLAERDQVAIWREHQQFTLPIVFVGRTMDIPWGQRGKFGFQLVIQRSHVPHINVVGETAISRRRSIAP